MTYSGVRTVVLRSAFCILTSALLGLGAGCTYSSATTQPTAGGTALGDPMHYGEKWDNPDISGGPINNFDKKAFDRDVDHVLNP